MKFGDKWMIDHRNDLKLTNHMVYLFGPYDFMFLQDLDRSIFII